MESIFARLRTPCINLATCFKIWSLGKYHLIDGPPLMASYVLSPHVPGLTQPILVVEHPRSIPPNWRITGGWELFVTCSLLNSWESNLERLALFKKNKAIISLFLECRFKQVKSA